MQRVLLPMKANNVVRGAALGPRTSPPTGSMRWWIAERRCRAVKTILVLASSRKDAQEKLDAGYGEGVDVQYYAIGRAKVLRSDNPSNNQIALDSQAS